MDTQSIVNIINQLSCSSCGGRGRRRSTKFKDEKYEKTCPECEGSGWGKRTPSEIIKTLYHVDGTE